MTFADPSIEHTTPQGPGFSDLIPNQLPTIAQFKAGVTVSVWAGIVLMVLFWAGA